MAAAIRTKVEVGFFEPVRFAAMWTIGNVLIRVSRIEPFKLMPPHIEPNINWFPRGRTIHEYL